MRLIDSHCHLNYEGLVERQDEVLATARARGVDRLPQHLDPPDANGTRSSPSPSANADVWATVGIHPHEADAHPDLGAAALVEARSTSAGDRDRRMRARLLLRQVRPRPRSASASQAHIEAARTTGLPLIVHTRDAEDDTAEILDRARWGRGRHRRPPLLHRQRGARAQGARSRLLHLASRAS